MTTTTPNLNLSPRNDPSLAALVGRRIAEARRARGLNRNQLATRLHTSWAAVNRWEKGRTYPSTDSIVRIAQVLSVSVDQLVGQEARSAAATKEELTNLVEQCPHLSVSDEEIRWLESAPVRSSALTAAEYAELLSVLRRARQREETVAPAPDSLAR